jgi:DNA-binding CsgD family transcriptional regulator
VLDPEHAVPATSWGALSARETEVLTMTALGMTNDEMAHRLAVTTHAVKFHLSSIYRKLGVANRTEAAAAFLTRS